MQKYRLLGVQAGPPTTVSNFKNYSGGRFVQYFMKEFLQSEFNNNLIIKERFIEL